MFRTDYSSSIRRRLFILLLRAFSVAVIVTVISILVLVAIVAGILQSDSLAFHQQIYSVLETYYLARGSWDGLDTFITENPNLFTGDTITRWKEVVLLDEDGVILSYQGDVHSDLVGTVYTNTLNWNEVSITAGDRQVGTMVIKPSVFLVRLRYLGALLFPVGFISIFLGVLTIIIGMLLTRRIINPLAQVIAASNRVANGDLSTRVKVEGPDDIRALSDSFNRMAGTLERNELERRNLLADVAHELRTPITVIQGRLEGIIDGVYPAHPDSITPVLEETYLLERLVEDLRVLTLAENRQLPFEKRPVNLGDLARQAAGLFEAEAEDKGIRIEVEDEAGERSVTADPQRTSQVIANLVSNALRYMSQAGRVRVRVEVVEESVSVAVADSGTGVPEADLPHLFDRFWRGEKSRSRAAGGAGLGLAIARQLIEAQGGSISARNLPEGGLEVRFTLPEEK